MEEIICKYCGGKVEGKNYFTYCSYKKCFLHVQCETVCENYSVNMLPNGTHCKKRYSDELNKYIMLSYGILAPKDEVENALSKYEKINSTELYEKFKTQVCLYNNVSRDEKHKRARMRVELAAMQQVLRKRELENPKLSTWARRFFGEVGDDC